MPTIIYLFGLRFFFYSEEHLPAKIIVSNLEVVENNGIKPKDIKKAITIVEEYESDYFKSVV